MFNFCIDYVSALNKNLVTWILLSMFISFVYVPTFAEKRTKEIKISAFGRELISSVINSSSTLKPLDQLSGDHKEINSVDNQVENNKNKENKNSHDIFTGKLKLEIDTSIVAQISSDNLTSEKQNHQLYLNIPKICLETELEVQLKTLDFRLFSRISPMGISLVNKICEDLKATIKPKDRNFQISGGIENYPDESLKVSSENISMYPGWKRLAFNENMIQREYFLLFDTKDLHSHNPNIGSCFLRIGLDLNSIHMFVKYSKDLEIQNIQSRINTLTSTLTKEKQALKNIVAEKKTIGFENEKEGVQMQYKLLDQIPTSDLYLDLFQIGATFDYDMYTKCEDVYSMKFGIFYNYGTFKIQKDLSASEYKKLVSNDSNWYIDTADNKNIRESLLEHKYPLNILRLGVIVAKDKFAFGAFYTNFFNTFDYSESFYLNESNAAPGLKRKMAITGASKQKSSTYCIGFSASYKKNILGISMEYERYKNAFGTLNSGALCFGAAFSGVEPYIGLSRISSELISDTINEKSQTKREQSNNSVFIGLKVNL